MYQVAQYVHTAKLFVRNSVLPRHKKLSTIMLYATDRCNSKCKHCFIWAKQPKKHLPLSVIKQLVNSKAVDKHTNFGLEGGEFILHPEAEEILAFFSKHHPNFDLLSNGLHKKKLIQMVRKYPPRHLYMSLDGLKENYTKVRGLDGSQNVVDIVRELKNEISISLMFTLTPFNNMDDLKEVMRFCKEEEVDLRIGIYSTMDFFDTTANAGDTQTLLFKPEDIPDEIKDFAENYDFMRLYPEFREGKLKLSCNSIMDRLVVYPNGDIPVCQFKEQIIGNVTRESLDSIINKQSTIDLQKDLKHNCNACWINFHRKFDIVLYRNLEKLFPKALVSALMGKYQWTNDRSKSYKSLIK